VPGGDYCHYDAEVFMEQNSKRHRVSTRLARQAFRITGNSQADHGHHDDRGRHRLGQGIEQAGENSSVSRTNSADVP
jgi:hypothetical protein